MVIHHFGLAESFFLRFFCQKNHSVLSKTGKMSKYIIAQVGNSGFMKYFFEIEIEYFQFKYRLCDHMTDKNTSQFNVFINYIRLILAECLHDAIQIASGCYTKLFCGFTKSDVERSYEGKRVTGRVQFYINLEKLLLRLS